MNSMESPPLHPTKALLVGYIGGINVGDEAIGGAVAITLKNHFNIDVSIISGNPEKTTNYLALNIKVIKGVYPGTKISSREYMKMVKAVKQTDTIIFVGGGILQDVHSTNLLFHCCIMSLLGRFFGKKIIALGIGAGPISSTRGKSITSTFLKNIDRMVVRDKYSYDYIRREHPESINKISTGSDSIFLLKDKLKNGKKTELTKIGLCFRCWPELNVDNFIRLTELILKSGSTPVFLAYEQNDLDLYHLLTAKFQNKVLLLEQASFESDIQSISELNGLISMRLHANLFAIMSHIPFVALSYDDKVINVISQSGFPNQVLPISSSPELIINQLHNFVALDTPNPQVESAYQENMVQLKKLLSRDYKKEHKAIQRLTAGVTSLKFASLILIMPFIRNNLMFIAEKTGHLFPQSLKNKIKRSVGIRW